MNMAVLKMQGCGSKGDDVLKTKGEICATAHPSRALQYLTGNRQTDIRADGCANRFPLNLTNIVPFGAAAQKGLAHAAIQVGSCCDSGWLMPRFRLAHAAIKIGSCHRRTSCSEGRYKQWSLALSATAGFFGGGAAAGSA